MKAAALHELDVELKNQKRQDTDFLPNVGVTCPNPSQNFCCIAAFYKAKF